MHRKNKILFVDDNRDSVNWGCRATSIALYRLLSGGFDVKETINKRSVDEQVPLCLFPFQNKYLAKGKYKNEIRQGLKKLINSQNLKSKLLLKFLACKGFLIDTDISKSVDRLIHYKKDFYELEAIYEKVSNADIVVINGEGSMIFTTPPRKDLLYQLMIIELSNKLKKPVFYINAMVSDCPNTGRNNDTYNTSMKILSKCNGVSVRDPFSLTILKGSPVKINAEYIPDALFTWYEDYKESLLIDCQNYINFFIPYPEYEHHIKRWDFSQPYICISDSSTPPKSVIEKNEEMFCILIEEVKKIGLPVYLVNTGGKAFLNTVGQKTGTPIIPANTNIFFGGLVLSNAEILISGRFHPSILASLGGTPCIFLESNSHKTISLQRVLEYEECKTFPLNLSKNDIDEIIQKAHGFLENKDFFKNSIKKTVQERDMEAKRIIQFIEQNI